MSFRDRVAVVTGGASGIGQALCAALAQAGARVTVADLDARGAATVAERIAGTHVQLDVANADDVASLVESTIAREGRIDLWINNAGIAVGGAATDLALADWRRVLDVNLAGVVHGVHAVYPRMVQQRAGHIVNIASVAGIAPYPFALPYTTSKHAVVGLSQALRAEARAHGVRVSVACPGRIATPIWEHSTVRGDIAKARDRVLARVSSGMSAERCAATILRGVAANRGVILVTAEAHLAWWINRASPTLAGWISHRVASVARSLA